jgi:hypothetical protein
MSEKALLLHSDMGRKAIHKPENLKIGEKMELTGKLKKYSWQYLNNFNERGDAKYKHVRDGNKVFIQRES